MKSFKEEQRMVMKKTGIIIIITLLVLGGLALAKENGNYKANGPKGFVKATGFVADNQPTNDRQDDQNHDRGMNLIAAAAKQKTKVAKAIKNLNNFRKRVITPATIRKLEGDFQAAKSRFMIAVNAHSQRKNQWIIARDRYNRACRDKDSAECQKLLNESIDRARQYLENSANMAITYLQQVKDKVDSTDSIPHDQVAEIDSDINDYISQLNDVLADLEKADTKDEIKADAKKIDSIWTSARYRVRSYAAYMLGSKVMSLSFRSDTLSDRLDCYLSEIEDQGKDITSLQDKVDEFNSRIEDARNYWNETEQLYEDLRILMKSKDKDLRQIREKSDELKDKVTEAHDSLNQAQKLLTQIFREIRSYDVNVASCNGVDYGHECENDSDCGSDETCQSYKCVANGHECENDSDCGTGEACESFKCVANNVNSYDDCIDSCKDVKSTCLEGDEYANEESQATFCNDQYDTCADICADAANKVCNDTYDSCADNCSDDKAACLDGNDYANEESQATFCDDQYVTCGDVCSFARDDCLV